MNIEEIRDRFLKGDNNALKDIYVEHHDDIIRVLIGKNICNEDEAEGYLTDAMIVFYESVSAGKLKELKSIKNYLVGICINLKKRAYDGKLKIETKVDEIRLHLYKNYDYSLNTTFNKSTLALVKSKLSQLSQRCQDIITTYYVDDLSMNEIAKYLDLSSGDVAKTLKSRCFKKLLESVKIKSK